MGLEQQAKTRSILPQLCHSKTIFTSHQQMDAVLACHVTLHSSLSSSTVYSIAPLPSFYQACPLKKLDFIFLSFLHHKVCIIFSLFSEFRSYEIIPGFGDFIYIYIYESFFGLFFHPSRILITHGLSLQYLSSRSLSSFPSHCHYYIFATHIFFHLFLKTSNKLSRLG